MALSFAHSTKLVGVPQADAQPLLMQALINAIRDEEASERGIVEPQIADASGKNDLGGGVMTGITVAFRSTWKLNFAAGAYQASLDGGNLADALSRINNTGSPQVLVLASAAATVVNSSGATPPTAPAIAAAVHDEIIEAGASFREMTRIAVAALAGTSQKSGSTITFKGIDGTTDRIVGTFDAENNRTAATLDGS